MGVIICNKKLDYSPLSAIDYLESSKFLNSYRMRVSTDSFSIFLSLTSAIVILVISEAEATDRITTTQFLGENETIVSSGGSFELGFFRPGSSQNLYLGIWYKKITTRTVVWVANREAPLTNRSIILKVSSPGILNLYNETGFIIWSSNTFRRVEDPIAQLLDSGNLVVREANDDNPENFLWQSFDYPGNTFLPGMKLGKNLITDLDRYLSSWKSNDDPAPGDYTYRMDTRGYPQFVLRNGAIEKFRPGPWNGFTFSGSSLTPNKIFNYSFVFSKEEVYYTYELINSSVVSRRVLNHSVGLMQRWTWADHRGWILYSEIPKDNCDMYASCGEYGSCNIGNSPQCGCLDKFVPRYQNNWDNGDWSGGCIRRVPLACRGGEGEGFKKFSGLKLPDTRNSWFNRSTTLEECRKLCLGNCSCMAYARLDIRKGASGCLMWLGSLVDIREADGGQDIYVKMASSELESGSQGMRRVAIIVSLALVIGVSLLCLSLGLYFWKKKHRQLERTGIMSHGSGHTETSKSHKEDLQLPSFDLDTIVDATDNFSLHKKLGEGGFGPVYKGVLEGGQEIAVKRLSSSSRQGLDEFKNEVIYIAKLQHRNLVKLLGCCIQGEEKMLIYEYLSNKSLDLFIFDETRSKLLDWPKRFHIIDGISRGLLYLHQDSRLRIIHRDLKASNILLDIDMTPKISDFGLARSFGANETEANTNRVVGTYGYMSPEYAVDGIFSVKSDVFSFGVLVLEILSGKRNRGFSNSHHLHNLLGHAWKLYQEGRALEVVDAAMVNSMYVSEMLKSIQVALLCVQQCPEDRPSMSSVVLMLGNGGSLPQPKQPGFFTERKVVEFEYSTSRDAPSSVNEITITLLDAR